MTKNYIIYNHGGSGNHGCEALVRTAVDLLGGVSAIYSEEPEQDKKYQLNQVAQIIPACHPYSKTTLDFAKAYVQMKLRGDYFAMDVLPYQRAIREMSEDVVEVSVGGDIYCYEDYPKFIRLHREIAKKHKSVLLGCSLEAKLFEDPEFVKDMQQYDLITARESLTYQSLKQAGFQQVKLIPDGAFTLKKELLPFPEGFDTSSIVGINISPLVLRKETKSGIVLENFVRLMRYILNTTDYTIALIPHVVWNDNDDRKALKELYDAVGEKKRVVLLEDHNCMQLKGFISRCRFFIGARTHATIAAYSTCVPTLVLGYSVKSRGIATDLFGTDEKYVVPVQKLSDPDEMVKAFGWMQEHEEEMREMLTHTMPGYMECISELKSCIEDAVKE